MNLPTYVFDVDHVAKIISELSITVLEEKNYRSEKTLHDFKPYLAKKCPLFSLPTVSKNNICTYVLA